MGSLAKQLLQETPKDPLQLKTYLLTAGIIGYLLADHQNEATRLWKEYSAIYPSLESVPTYSKNSRCRCISINPGKTITDMARPLIWQQS